MEHFDPSYHRKHAKLLFVGYFLLAIILFSLTALSLLEANGFYVKTDGAIVRNGLLIVDTRPRGAQVFIDGEPESDRTSSRFVLPEGKHNIDIRLPGRIAWTKSFELAGGGVTFLEYPLLFPQEPEFIDAASYSLNKSPVVALSPDSRWLLVANSTSQPRFDIFRADLQIITSETVGYASTLRLTDTLVNYSIEQWLDDNDRFVLKLDYVTTNDVPNGSDYWLVSRTGNFANQKIFKVPGQALIKEMEITQDGSDLSAYVLYNSGLLLKQELVPASQIAENSRVIDRQVSDFDLIGPNKITYVNRLDDDTLQIKAQALTEPQELIREFTGIDSEDISLYGAIYEGDSLIAVSNKAEDKVYVYTNPFEELVANVNNLEAAALLVPGLSIKTSGLQQISFSSNNRILAIVEENGLVVYDNEVNKVSRYTRDNLPASYTPEWLDGHYLVYRSQNQVEIWDFDNSNSVTYDLNLGVKPVITNNKESMYILTKNENLYALKKLDFSAVTSAVN